MYRMSEKLEWGKLATFVPNKRLPVYNWFYYKEGFARELVFRVAETFSLGEGSVVLDPFCGAGTTPLACREMGMNCFAFDVHPVSVFASSVKTRDYDTGILRESAREILETRFRRISLPKDRLIRRAFKKETLEDIILFREEIAGIEDEKVREFLLLGLMNAAMKASYVFKDGAVLRFRKRHVPPLRQMFRRQVHRMIRDLEGFKTRECETRVGFGDARSLPLPDCSVDAVITSPPYLNKIEYTRVYEIEQRLFLGFMKGIPPVRSYIGSLDRKGTGRKEIEDALGRDADSLPEGAVPYFADMKRAVEEMHRVCRSGGRVALVVGNGCFPDRVVESDILLSRIAENAGFTVKNIIVLNKRWCTRHRVEKVGIARESLLLWEKEE